MKKVYFETYGCQMNKAESQAVAATLTGKRWQITEDPGEADAVIVHTCSVRKSAEQRVWGRLGELTAKKKETPFILAVAGCMADRVGDEIREKFPQVDLVLGNTVKLDLFRYLDEAEQRGEGSGTDGPGGGNRIRRNMNGYVFPVHFGYSGKLHAYVPVMHGCDNYCSYCVVPYVRGREVSRKPKEIMAEIGNLGRSGTKEITLLGQNVNSYRSEYRGATIGFPRLLELILSSDDAVPWFRFLTSHPKDLSEDLIEVMKRSPRLCRHIHLPLQSGSDRILKLMNRSYSSGRYRRLADTIRESMPDVSLTTDIIVGFPGESESDYEQTVRMLKDVRFEDAFTYKYNAMERTRAASMEDQVPEPVKQRRLEQLIDFQRNISHTIRMMKIGKTLNVLIGQRSKKNSGEYLAKSEYNDMVIVPGREELIGTFSSVRIGELRGSTLKGEIIWSHGN